MESKEFRLGLAALSYPQTQSAKRRAQSAKRAVNSERLTDCALAPRLFTAYHLPFTLSFAMRHALCSMRFELDLKTVDQKIYSS
jgi:hypothetical protein